MVLVFVMMWHCLHLLELLWTIGYVVCSFVVDQLVSVNEQFFLYTRITELDEYILIDRKSVV